MQRPWAYHLRTTLSYITPHFGALPLPLGPPLPSQTRETHPPALGTTSRAHVHAHTHTSSHAHAPNSILYSHQHVQHGGDAQRTHDANGQAAPRVYGLLCSGGHLPTQHMGSRDERSLLRHRRCLLIPGGACPFGQCCPLLSGGAFLCTWTVPTHLLVSNLCSACLFGQCLLSKTGQGRRKGEGPTACSVRQYSHA